jgi:DNA-binding SARP family transcriptional activator
MAESGTTVLGARDPFLRPDGVRLRLTSEFELWIDGPVALPRGTQRVVAFLAVARAWVSRSRLSGILWTDVSQRQADGSLRSALWRLGAVAGDVLERRGDRLAIAPRVRVDAWELEEAAERILTRDVEDLDRIGDLAAAPEILPGWDDAWLAAERERYRQLRLHALERAGGRFVRSGDFARAIEVGLAAVEAEPFRESAHRLLIEAHLGEGNAGEAARQYVAYRRLASEELGVSPSARMEALIEPIRAAITTIDPPPRAGVRRRGQENARRNLDR